MEGRATFTMTASNVTRKKPRTAAVSVIPGRIGTDRSACVSVVGDKPSVARAAFAAGSRGVGEVTIEPSCAISQTFTRLYIPS
jgi:phosphoglycolate phosphatase-like HAD superfamily hydrolase